MKKNVKANNQLNAFDVDDAERLRQAREVAMRIAFEEGTVSADVVREKFPVVECLHRNAIGSLFKTNEFEFAGIKKSRTPSRKGGIIMTYRLTNDAEAMVRMNYSRFAGK